MEKHLLAVDLANLAMRLFYRKKCSEPQDVVDPLINALGALKREYAPDFLVLAADSADCFRYSLYPEYKGEAGEGVTAQDVLAVAIPQLRDEGWAVLQEDGYEADDILATLQCKCAYAKTDLSILSNDWDLFQLAGYVAQILYPEKGQIIPIRTQEVKDRTGVFPAQIPDLKAMAGDKSDNIPPIGYSEEEKALDEVKPPYRITEKRAAELLAEYGTLDAVYLHSGWLPEKERRWMEQCVERALRMRLLIQLCTDVSLDMDELRRAAC